MSMTATLLLAASAGAVAFGTPRRLPTKFTPTPLLRTRARPAIAAEKGEAEGATAAVADAVKVWAKDVGITEAQPASAVAYQTTGEDAAAFSWEAQQGIQWIRFTAAVSVVLGALYVLWINPTTGVTLEERELESSKRMSDRRRTRADAKPSGSPRVANTRCTARQCSQHLPSLLRHPSGSPPATPGYGDDFTAGLESLCGGNSHLVTLCMGIIFPLAHSGLASLRPSAEPIVGPRAWRVLFACVSLPLAYSWIVYFIAHRYDGIIFYDLHTLPAAHAISWLISYLSFFFLYPSTFNLLEVPANPYCQ